MIRQRSKWRHVVLLDTDHKDALRRIADANRIGVSTLIRMVIADYLENQPDLARPDRSGLPGNPGAG